jgi:hypothetical protein
MNPRYALYYTPAPGHPLWAAGCAWLQRDPMGRDVREPRRPHIREPWRYGFHATLKPPMRLAAGRDEGGLIAAITELAARSRRFEMPRLRVQWLSDFLALCPAAALPRDHALHRLADACVTTLDAWRAAPEADELQRRLARAHDTSQREAILRFGYPHVLDLWRFHMTLSDSLAEHDTPTRDTMQHEAERHFAAALQAPLACEAIALFVEPAPGRPLHLQQLFPLVA